VVVAAGAVVVSTVRYLPSQMPSTVTPSSLTMVYRRPATYVRSVSEPGGCNDDDGVMTALTAAGCLLTHDDDETGSVDEDELTDQSNNTIRYSFITVADRPLRK